MSELLLLYCPFLLLHQRELGSVPAVARRPNSFALLPRKSAALQTSQELANEEKYLLLVLVWLYLFLLKKGEVFLNVKAGFFYREESKAKHTFKGLSAWRRCYSLERNPGHTNSHAISVPLVLSTFLITESFKIWKLRQRRSKFMKLWTLNRPPYHFCHKNMFTNWLDLRTGFHCSPSKTNPFLKYIFQSIFEIIIIEPVVTVHDKTQYLF